LGCSPAGTLPKRGAIYSHGPHHARAFFASAVD